MFCGCTATHPLIDGVYVLRARQRPQNIHTIMEKSTMPSWHFALSHASTASMHSILNLAFYRKCGKLPMVSHRFRRIPEQARAVAKSFFAAFGGREGGEDRGHSPRAPSQRACRPLQSRFQAGMY